MYRTGEGIRLLREAVLLVRRQPLATVLLMVTTVLTGVVVTVGLHTRREISRIKDVLSEDMPVTFLWRGQGGGIDDAALRSLVDQSVNVRRVSPWVASVHYALPLLNAGQPLSTETAWRVIPRWVYPEAVKIAQLEIVAGQPISEVDWRNKVRVALLSIDAARTLFGGDSPAAWVGRQFLLGDDPAPFVRVYLEADPAASATERQKEASEGKAEALAKASGSELYTVAGVFRASPELKWAGAVPMMLLPSSVAPAFLSVSGTSTASGTSAKHLAITAGIVQPASGRTDEALRDLRVLLNGPTSDSTPTVSDAFSISKDPSRMLALDTLGKNTAHARLQILLSTLVALASQFAVLWSILGKRIWEFGLRRCLGMGRSRLMLETAVGVSLLSLPAFTVVIPLVWFILNSLVRPSILTLTVEGAPAVSPGSIGAVLTAVGAAAAAVTMLVWVVAFIAAYEMSRLPPSLALREGSGPG